MAESRTTKNGVDPIESALENGSEAVRDGLEKAAQAYEQAFAFSKENAEAVLKSANLAGKGIEAINSEAFAYSRQSVQESVAATKAMLGSKSVQELFELQSDYVKSAFQAYLGEMNKVRELALTTAKDAAEPLQARFTAFTDLVQTRPV